MLLIPIGLSGSKLDINTAVNMISQPTEECTPEKKARIF